MNFKIIEDLKKVGLILFALILIGSMILSFLKVGINKDSYYYIEISRLLLLGKGLFVDFPPEYTPLSFYLMCIPFSLFGVSFQIGIIATYLLQMVNSFLVYKICVKYTKEKEIAIFFALFSCLLCWISGGPDYILEPFVLFFGLCSLLVLEKNKRSYVFISGMLSFCAFWCKQYGLGFIVLAIVYLFMLNKFDRDLIKKELCLFAGFVLGLIISVSIYLIQGAELGSLAILTGSDYEREGIHGFIYAWRNSFLFIPMLLVAILMLAIKFKDSIKSPLYVLGICGLCGFMLQTYVRFYAHYLILVQPFVAMLIMAAVLLIKKENYRKLYMSFVLISTMIPLYFLMKSNVGLYKSHIKASQVELSNEIVKVIPHGTCDVYAGSDLLPIMMLNEYGSPYISKFGPTNGFAVVANQIYEMVNKASFCILSDEDYNNHPKYSAEVKKYIASNFSKRILEYKDLDGETKVYYIFERLHTNQIKN